MVKKKVETEQLAETSGEEESAVEKAAPSEEPVQPPYLRYAELDSPERKN